ncbi:hypothetical protein DSCW_65250 [Desulfosarcina widdelii]|uniref:Uncharacterized protein n=1 Tax=Desulfosarcina widdelii TaxID=947919 RepID=A0A5K7ZD91_9BACT|nr:hypothetical protein DSCW_65250 [Desulfosarcina widdelii]
MRASNKFKPNAIPATLRIWRASSDFTALPAVLPASLPGYSFSCSKTRLG